MRDRNGLVQIALDPEKFANRAEIRPECCLEVTGVVTLRDEKTKNAEMPTGEIEVDAHGATSLPGVFAGGDALTRPYKQISIALGEGSKAALSAFDYLIRLSAEVKAAA
jgi:NADPH-dependent glutamate synthase beta subunit-like oxidoreductase